MGAMEKMDWQGGFEKAHPGKSIEEVDAMIQKTQKAGTQADLVSTGKADPC